MFVKTLILAGAWALLFAEVGFAQETQWPGAKVAISLSYDDSLHSQLDHALPALDEHGFKASFYVVPVSDAFQTRLEEWRAAAARGHEMGNHTLKHSCRSSLANREWVLDSQDLDTQTVQQVVTEVRIASTLLQALDGRTERTFTIPCGDVLAGGKNYVDLIANEFVAVKGQGIANGFSSLYVADGDTADQLIDYVESQSSKVKLINILFHGVGGDHLSVSSEAHAKLLHFLADNKDKYWVDTYLTIMQAK